jgi:uncharacterized protein
MPGISDLAELLRQMQPVLHDEAYGIVVANDGAVANAFATIREDEGMTVVATIKDLNASGITDASQWARITLQVHSSLNAVGLTAAFATALGNHGISANVIAGYHHDHIFVQWDKRHDAMQALQQLSNN